MMTPSNFLNFYAVTLLWCCPLCPECPLGHWWGNFFFRSYVYFSVVCFLEKTAFLAFKQVQKWKCVEIRCASLILSNTQELCSSRRYPLQSSLAFIRLTCVMYCSSKCHYEMPLGRHLPWHHSPSQWRSPSHAHKISRHCSLLSREGGRGNITHVRT